MTIPDKPSEPQGGQRNPMLAFVMAGLIVLLLILFLLLRPGGTKGGSGTENNKPTAPMTKQ